VHECIQFYRRCRRGERTNGVSDVRSSVRVRRRGRLGRAGDLRRSHCVHVLKQERVEWGNGDGLLSVTRTHELIESLVSSRFLTPTCETTPCPYQLITDTNASSELRKPAINPARPRRWFRMPPAFSEEHALVDVFFFILACIADPSPPVRLW